MNLKVGAIGVGQCGNKMLKAFIARKLPVLAVNTTELDMRIPGLEKQTCLIKAEGTGGGAGKNPAIGARAAKEHAATIARAMSERFTDMDVLVYIAGLGGGTGTGVTPHIFDMGALTKRRLVVVTLPHAGEGVDEKINAVNTFSVIWDSARSEMVPVMVIDNDKVMDALDRRHATMESANEEIFADYLRICELVATESKISSFDPTDFSTVMRSAGRMAVCRTTESWSKEYKDPRETIAQFIQKSWTKGNRYGCEFDPNTAAYSATLVVVPKRKADDAFLSQVQRGVHDAAKQLTPHKSFTGIYVADNDTEFLEFVSVFAGMLPPTDKVNGIRQAAANNIKAFQEKIAIRRKADEEISSAEELSLSLEEEPPARKKSAPVLAVVTGGGDSELVDFFNSRKVK